VPAPDAAALRACPLDAAASKREGAAQQMALVRALREVHTSSCNLALKEGLAEDVEAEVQAAMHRPLVALRSQDALLRRVQQHKAAAQALRARKAFMSHRLQEAQAPAEPQPDAPPQAPPAPPPAAAAASASADEAGPSASAAAAPELLAAPGPTAMEVKRAGVECPICLHDIAGDAQLAPCGHVFCLPCLHKLVSPGSTVFGCPVCRARLTTRAMVRVAPSAPPRAAAAGCDPGAERDPALAAVQVQGQWSIKVEALLRRLLALAAGAPQEKSLVFSLYPEALRLVAVALRQNGLAHVELLGGGRAVRGCDAVLSAPAAAAAAAAAAVPAGLTLITRRRPSSQGAKKAIQEFRENDEARVFLLSHRAGAQGLTLVRANNVFLLEPALDPSIEQQAIARVHRIGQQRPVRVTRLVVGSTIEEEVLRLQRGRQALFEEGGAGGDEEDVTAVDHAAAAEAVGQEEAEKLLDALLV
jgi:E3 ubiquitin-protein ligase SHPRH